MTKIIDSSVALAAIGCAAAPLPELGPDHPGSPEAAEAPMQPVSETLSPRVNAGEEEPDEAPKHAGHHAH